MCDIQKQAGARLLISEHCVFTNDVVFDECVQSVYKFQKDTACTRLECCRQLHKFYTTPAPRDGDPIPLLGFLLPGWLCSPVIWICDLCHKQINKQQTSIRCNHTQHTLGSSEMHTDTTATIQIWREMNHSHTHTNRNNNTTDRQHFNST